MNNLHDKKSIPNGQILAIQNELKILNFLHRFGWLRTRDLAGLVWHNSTSANSGIVMAQRTLKRLKDTAQVLHRIAPDGATIYSLSQSGARRLGEDAGITARSGKDLIREVGNYQHRCLANMFAISRLKAAQKVWTEHEIQTNRAPIKSVLQKIPDCLIEYESSNFAWVEIERGYKKEADFNKMMKFCFTVLGGLDAGDQPRNTLFCADMNNDMYIEHVIIQIVSSMQANRIIQVVASTKEKNPYAYNWGSVLAGLFLCSPTSDLMAMSKWVSDF